MKKLSIILALIMALSCFCFTAFAAEGDACDYTALNAAIAEATLKDTTKYTDDSVKTFKTAFDAAKAVDRELKVDEKGDNQKKIDEAAAALDKAIKDLKEKPSETTTAKETTTAAPVKVTVHVIATDMNGNPIKNGIYPYDLPLDGYKVGDTIKSEAIIKTVKARVLDKEVGNNVIDTEKFVVSPVVVLKDYESNEGIEVESVTFGNGRTYDFYVYVFEIDPVENLAQVAATELAGKVDWKGVASANTALINQIINGAKSAADSLAKADYPEIGEKKTEDAAKKADGAVKGEKVVRTPDTGASAVAGVAVVVLALSATTAVVLRKKED